MTRTTIPSAMPAERAEALSDNEREITSSEQAQVNARADELMHERLSDRARFDDLLSVIEPIEINHPLHRALQNLDNACSGSRTGIDAVLTALCHIQRTVAAEAERSWRAECIAEAEWELP